MHESKLADRQPFRQYWLLCILLANDYLVKHTKSRRMIQLWDVTEACTLGMRGSLVEPCSQYLFPMVWL